MNSRFHLGARSFLFKVAIVFTVCASAWAVVPEDMEITEIGDLSRGEFVTVRGRITRFNDYDELRLRDESGQVDIYLGEAPMRRPPFSLGDTITVAGWVDDALIQLPFKEIYATEIYLEDGTVLSVGRDSGWD